MNTKHTPGPWKVEFTGDKQITLKNWKSLKPCTSDADYEQINTLDAALIAAAPEMLEALDLIITNGLLVKDVKDEIYDKLYATLSKARGAS